MVQQPSRLGGPRHAGVEHIVTRADVAVASLARQDRVVADRGERFAGHVGRESDDPSVHHRGPLAVTAREARDTGADLCPDDLCLLASHELGDAVGIGGRDAGYDPHGRAVEGHGSESACEIGDPGGTGDRPGFPPSLPAADHAREEYAVLTVRQPLADTFAQHFREVAV